MGWTCLEYPARSSACVEARLVSHVDSLLGSDAYTIGCLVNRQQFCYGDDLEDIMWTSMPMCNRCVCCVILKDSKCDSACYICDKYTCINAMRITRLCQSKYVIHTTVPI